ncbi:MAG: CAP domain-containing protein [Flavobacteriaceae bacterium]|nr:CAP domain-containing protein [Flavobacteriaceae bacterium]
MKKTFLLVLFIALLTACSKDDDGIYFQAELPNVSTYTDLETSIIHLLNEHRVSLGLNPVAPLDIISDKSSIHTNYMIKNNEISHQNFKNRADYLIQNAQAISVGENVAYGYSSAEGVVRGWLNSDAHRITIETPHYTNIGISIKENEHHRNFFTTIFIQR